MCGCGEQGPRQDEVAYRRAGCDHDRLRLGCCPSGDGGTFCRSRGAGGGHEGKGSESDGHQLHHLGPFCASLEDDGSSALPFLDLCQQTAAAGRPSSMTLSGWVFSSSFFSSSSLFFSQQHGGTGCGK